MTAVGSSPARILDRAVSKCLSTSSFKGPEEAVEVELDRDSRAERAAWMSIVSVLCWVRVGEDEYRLL
jgi:hypothetical protein